MDDVTGLEDVRIQCKQHDVLAVSVWAQMAGLVARIPPPEGPSERTLAGLVVSRAGWEILRQQTERGLKTHHQVVDDWTRLLDLVETGPWCEMAERLRAAGGAAEPTAIAVRARAILDSHTTTPMTLAAVAGAVRCSVRLLTDQFRGRYGLSVHEYVTRRRLAAAMDLLLATDLKVSSIAKFVGFRDESCLYRHFHRMFSTTPASLRREPQEAARLARELSALSESTRVRDRSRMPE